MKGVPKTVNILDPIIPYNVPEFAHQTYGYGRTALVTGEAFDMFKEWIKRDYEKNVNPGDILILTPKNHKKKCRITRYNPDDEKYIRDQDYTRVLNDIFSYSGQHDTYFGDIVFEEDARKTEYKERIKEIREKEKQLSNSELQELFDDQEKQLDEKDMRIHELSSQYQALEHQYRSIIKSNSPANSGVLVDDTMIDYPKDPVKVALVFEKLYGDKIAFTNRCKKSLQECNTDSSIVWECFAYMGSVLRNMYLNNESNIEKAFHERTGYEIALGEGPATRQNPSLMKLREDTYEGRTILAEPHLKKGIRDADSTSIRVYYVFDKSTNKIIISYCSGRHLENASTRHT